MGLDVQRYLIIRMREKREWPEINKTRILPKTNKLIQGNMIHAVYRFKSGNGSLKYLYSHRQHSPQLICSTATSRWNFKEEYEYTKTDLFYLEVDG